MKDNKSGWQFPKALEIIKCKEGNKEFMNERPAIRAPRIDFPAIVERHDADAEETEGGEDED